MTGTNAVDHLTQKFPGGPLNSRRFPGFPRGFLNSSRFPGVVDTLFIITLSDIFSSLTNLISGKPVKHKPAVIDLVHILNVS